MPLFEQVYCPKFNRNLSLYELRKERKLDRALELRCPDCGAPELVYVEHIDPPHLRTHSKQLHDKDCPKYHKPISDKELIVYSSDGKETLDIIFHRLAALLDWDDSSPAKGKASPFLVPAIEEDGNGNLAKPSKKNRVQISRKMLKLPIDEALDETKMFYGTVKLAWLSPKIPDTYGRHTLKVSSEDGLYICSLWLSDGVYNHLPSEYKELTDNAYRLVFFSKIEKRGTFYNVKIKHSQMLQLRQL